jgi:hypothetical protein
MKIRVALWVLALAAAGYILASRMSVGLMVVGAVLGALVGLGMEMLFSRRAIRKHRTAA